MPRMAGVDVRRGRVPDGLVVSAPAAMGRRRSAGRAGRGSGSRGRYALAGAAVVRRRSAEQTK